MLTYFNVQKPIIAFVDIMGYNNNAFKHEPRDW